MFTVSASPVTAFVDAFRAALVADTNGSEAVMALATGVYGHVSEAARTAYPYLVIGRRTRDNVGGAMQRAGGQVTLQLDGWSDAKGPYQIQRLLSRVAQLIERRPLAVAGFDVVEGSLTCELEEVFDEPDVDKPDARLYHGMQRWTCEIHEAA